MADVIRLLPDAIANQIAAGEVVQRPASVVKELMENALDAGATEIDLHFKDGGSTLIQVIDNGKGMSETDARMCWERHATSKIRKAEDLYDLHSFGFRGEAMASIAAVARVEMKTRRPEDELGSLMVVEASEVRLHEAAQCPAGTSIVVRNLFFNIPARKNFLKSVSVETRHILEEFSRIALSRPEIKLRAWHADKQIYDLPASNLKERIRILFNLDREEDLFALEEKTDIVHIHGFAGSPQSAQRQRGEQYFIANGRFIRDPYFHHAVNTAYQGLIDKEKFPVYVICLDVEPQKIDVNVHPTKTEVKFEDSRAMYAILHSVMRKALAGYNQAPELFSDQEYHPIHSSSRQQDSGDMRIPKSPEIRINPAYNPFGESSGRKRELTHWEKIYEPFRQAEKNDTEAGKRIVPLFDEESKPLYPIAFFQLDQGWIIAKYGGELLVIRQHEAHERVLYERCVKAMSHQQVPSQQLLFPRTVQLPTADAEMLEGLLDEINLLGFDVSIFGKDTFIVNGLPTDIQKAEASEMLKGLLQSYKSNQQQLKLDKRESLARSMAQQAAIKAGQKLAEQEAESLVRDLMQCDEPAYTPGGKPVFVRFNPDKLNELLKRT
jgi:DNA mismatch repair protein MutL